MDSKALGWRALPGLAGLAGGREAGAGLIKTGIYPAVCQREGRATDHTVRQPCAGAKGLAVCSSCSLRKEHSSMVATLALAL